MMRETSPTQSVERAGTTGETTGVGSEVEGVRSSEDISRLVLWTIRPETRGYLASARKDAAYSHASELSEGEGDGPHGIATPPRHRHLQRTLYRKAKAGPGYRFRSPYKELTRRDCCSTRFGWSCAMPEHREGTSKAIAGGNRFAAGGEAVLRPRRVRDGPGVCRNQRRGARFKAALRPRVAG